MTAARARDIRTRISVPLDVERGMEVGGRPKEVAQRTDQFPRQLNDLHALVADNARGGDHQLLSPFLDGEFEGRSAVQLTCVDELYERGGLVRLHVHANLAPGCSHEHAIRLSPLQRARHPSLLDQGTDTRAGISKRSPSHRAVCNFAYSRRR